MSATVLRDAVWGDVELAPPQVALIDTPAFQRLRRVRQLGFTDLVFPGAHHTRFEHSIGVFHLAAVLLDRLSRGGGLEVSRREADTFLAAALLHDVGHYPFSHAVEELEVDQVRRHEDIARDVIATDLASILERDWDVDPADVAYLVAGPMRGDAERPETLTLLRSCLDSSLDVDKLDYLVRDARAANVPYGTVDVQRLIGALAPWRNADGRLALAVHAKGLAALQSLVFAKHLMFATVYWHHACRAAVAMLLRGLQAALAGGSLSARQLQRCDDAQLLGILSSGDMPPLTRDLADRLLNRRLYKRAVEITVQQEAFGRLEPLWFRPERRAQVEDRWAAEAGGVAGDVLLDIPEPRAISLDLPVVDVGGRAVAWDQVSGLGAADLERYQLWVRKVRVFVADPSMAGKVAEVVAAA